MAAPSTVLHAATPAGVVALIADAPQGGRRLLAGRASLLPSRDGLPAEGERDVTNLAARLARLRDEVAARFVAREELALATACAMAAGEHLFVLSPPGAAKSAFLRAFAEGVGGRFFRAVLNPDLPREAIFGAIDPAALAEGRWRRRWDGLARAHIALLDEVFKASPQVLNILLDALEERRAGAGEDEVALPLVMAMGASNEAPEEPELRAVYDRFLIRLTVGYVQDPTAFRGLLAADAGSTPISPTLAAEELMLLAAATEALSLRPPQEVVEAMATVWSELHDRTISDRRWRRSLKVATAHALLRGAMAPEPHDLAALRWTLWVDPQEEKEVRDLVLGLTDPLAGRVLDLEALLADLSRRMGSLAQMKGEEKARLLRELRGLRSEAEALLPQGGRYAPRLQAVAGQAQAMAEEVINSF